VAEELPSLRLNDREEYEVRANLAQGKLVAPTSLLAAQIRLKKLKGEVTRIQNQLDDPKRILRYTDTGEYDLWKAAASHALAKFKQELVQLEEWIATQQGTLENLLKRAYEVLKALQLDEVDFEPEELELIEQLDRYYERSTLLVTNNQGETNAEEG
jgi:hypothetical protein